MSEPKDEGQERAEKKEPSAESPKPGALFQNTAEATKPRPGGLLLGLIVGGAVLLLGFYLFRVYQNATTVRPTPSAAVAPSVPEEGPILPLDAMVPVLGGTLKMGSTDGDPDERVSAEIKVDTFSIDLTEVTVVAYQGCIEAGKCSPPDNTSPTCNWNKPGRDRHPINCVDWRQAMAYCAFVGKRLPTEPEWEYAARGTDGRKYPWKDGPPATQLCWDGDGNDLGKSNRQGTCAVGRYPTGASAFGAYDMAGNVWEWTASTYCLSYEGKDCKEDRKVIRGGGWNNVKAEYVRAQDRSDELVKARNDNVGFRCAKTPK